MSPVSHTEGAVPDRAVWQLGEVVNLDAEKAVDCSLCSWLLI